MENFVLDSVHWNPLWHFDIPWHLIPSPADDTNDDEKDRATEEEPRRGLRTLDQSETASAVTWPADEDFRNFPLFTIERPKREDLRAIIIRNLYEFSQSDIAFWVFDPLIVHDG